MLFPDNDEKDQSEIKPEDKPNSKDELDSGNNSDDDSQEDQDDSKEDDEDSEDISKKYFTDPDSLPKELRGAFKKMQAVYTRRMQEASLGARKAKAFDQLVLDPEFRQWMETRKNAALKGSRKVNENNEDEDEDEDTPITKKSLRAELSKIQSVLVKDKQEEKLREEAKQFKKDNPDWEIYKDEILEIMENHPTMGYQDAYDYAKYKSSADTSVERKRKANINKPSRTTGKEIHKKGKMTVQQAFEEAKRKLGIK